MEASRHTYFSHGKLLITSEYVIIDGALALALPTKRGQWLKAYAIRESQIHWMSRNSEGEIWFEGFFELGSFEIIRATDNTVANRLSLLLRSANALDATKTLMKKGWNVTTELEFPNDWGLGSSSTLICNLAKWLGIDAYQLHFSVSQGSGYDIACGMLGQSLIYEVHGTKTKATPIDFLPKFSPHIFFIHLNQKQISDREVERYSQLKKEIDLPQGVETFSAITNKILEAKSLESFEKAIEEHEHLMSNLLQQETIKEQLFPMYPSGIIKSLGAWGGDFVMVTVKEMDDLDYFKERGFHTILSFADLIKTI